MIFEQRSAWNKGPSHDHQREENILGREKNNTKTLRVANTHFLYNQVKNDKVISFGWNRKRILQGYRRFPSPGPPSLNRPVTLWMATMKGKLGLSFHPWFYSTSCKSTLFKGLGLFPLLTNIQEDNMSQHHSLPMSGKSCWMSALCPVTEWCGAFQRSMKHIVAIV